MGIRLLLRRIRVNRRLVGRPPCRRALVMRYALFPLCLVEYPWAYRLSNGALLQPLSKPDLPHVTIAVVGGDQAGKTTFITSALDMRHPATSRTTTKKMSLDGSVYLVRLLEIGSKEITRDPKGPIWPRFGNDPSPPSIDGVLVLHDTTQPALFTEIVNLLGVFLCPTNPGTPVVPPFEPPTSRSLSSSG